ncbi:ferredoxin reductase family protein [Microbacterium sp. 1P10UB]|uniref:ferredoxin reductase family protein n=1 Tax=unclassified Microbacterium TaxID=2609290 RepID=UPI0039A22B3A
MSTQQATLLPATSAPGLRVPRVDRRRQYARRARMSDLLVTLLWASGAAATALYLAYGGLADWTSTAGVVTGLGIIAGLVGTDFVLVMLLLAARVPIIDRTVGHDRAIATHRRLGKPALYLLLAHGLLLLVGYGMSAGIDPIAEIEAMLALPDMPLAFVAMGLFIAVVVTSLVAVRRKFSYEGWHLIHLLSYAAVIFAVPHQFSNGGVLAAGTWQQVYWIALYVTALSAIVVCRFVTPIVSTLRHQITVSGTETLSPGVVSIHLRGRNLRRLRSEGGQFLIWRFWTGKTWYHSHPISLSAMPSDSHVRITVRDLGAGSQRIGRVPAGTRVSMEGPYGLFSDVARTSPRLAIIAAGIGVTPARTLLESSPLTPGEATILLRAGDRDEMYLWDEIEQIAAAKDATLYRSVGHRGAGVSSWLAAEDAARGVSLQSIFPKLMHSDLYLCGPSAWLDAVEAEARSLGVPEHHIHAERLDW